LTIFIDEIFYLHASQPLANKKNKELKLYMNALSSIVNLNPHLAS